MSAVMPQGAWSAPAAASCFHCGLPVMGIAYPVRIEGVERDTCCRGCQAVAGLIAGSGLQAYYQRRSALPPKAEDPAAISRFAAFDMPAVQQGFVHERGTEREASLLLEGITCSACVWLIEQHLLRLPGMRGVSMNYATRRVIARWDASQLKLSAILAAIAALGYGAGLYDAARSETLLAAERRALLWRLFVAAFGMMQVMMYAFPAYVTDGQMPADIERLMQVAALVLTLPVMLWSAMPFYRGAWRSLRARALNMDVPISLGILTAFAASVLATGTGSGAVYYDSVCMFVFLLLGARYLEVNARAFAAREQDRLARLVPAMATRLAGYPDACSREQVPAASLGTGDVVEIRPGESVPGDGVVLEGRSTVNEALLTGESVPRHRVAGDRLAAGSVNGEGVLVARMTQTGQHTMIADIVRLMDRALESRPQWASLADAAASRFVVMLLMVTFVSALAWWFIDRDRVLWVTISLLVVTCPCALSLATPAALVAATGALSRRGILVTRGHVIEALAHTDHFVFDKTGTLTHGRLHVVGVLPLGGHAADTVSAIAAALESSSTHPVGRALADAAPPTGRVAVADIRHVTGHGVEGVVNGERMRLGSPRFVAELNGLPLPSELVFVSDDVTTVALGNEREWLALFTLGDTLRPDARRVIHSLSAQGASVHVLSGDRAPCVRRVAQQLGVRVAEGDATPSGKLAYVRALQGQGARVAVIGDGINDAPVLAQAQVSVAMACGADLARLNADVALLSDRLEPLLDAVNIARRALQIIRQNLVWAIAYNAVAVPLAVAGQVTPLIAAAGMSLSSLLVIGNALRLCRGESVSGSR